MPAMTHLIYSRQHDAYWAPNERGYVTQIILAGVYSQERAEQIAANSRGEDVAVTLEQAVAKCLGCRDVTGTVLEQLGMGRVL